MCEPTSIMAGISLVIGTVSALAQKKQQDAMVKTNERQARDAYILQTAQMNRRAMEEQRAASQKKEDARIKTMKGKAKVKTAAAAGGVSGQGVQTLLGDFHRALGQYTHRTDQGLDATLLSIRDQKQGLKSQADARIASVPPAGWGGVFGAVAGGAAKLGGAVYSDFFDASDVTADPTPA